MRLKLLLFILTLLYLPACRNRQPQPLLNNFFPVVAFLQGQIHLVDSLRLPLTKITTVNSKSDTASIQLPAFRLLANAFLKPDINDPALHKYYKETSFADQTIASITLTYSTTDKNLLLQRLDVIIHPDPVLNDRVSSIFMEKNYAVKDTAVIQKLYWKADRNYQVITTRQAGTWEETTVTKVEWKADE